MARDLTYKLVKEALGDTALNLFLAGGLFAIVRYLFVFVGPIPTIPFLTFPEFCVVVAMVFFVKVQGHDMMDKLRSATETKVVQ